QPHGRRRQASEHRAGPRTLPDQTSLSHMTNLAFGRQRASRTDGRRGAGRARTCAGITPALPSRVYLPGWTLISSFTCLTPGTWLAIWTASLRAISVCTEPDSLTTSFLVSTSTSLAPGTAAFSFCLICEVIHSSL